MIKEEEEKEEPLNPLENERLTKVFNFIGTDMRLLLSC